MVPLSRYIAFFSVAGGGVAVDLATKYWMFERLGMPRPGGFERPWLQCGQFFLGLQTSLNEGALFGMGQGMWPVFAVLSVLAAAGVFVWLFVVGAADDWWLTVALSLVTAGIFGNLYDRLGLWSHGGQSFHAVRDFILMGVGRWHWPNYNVADSMLVCGAILLVCHAFLIQSDQGQRDSESKTGEMEEIAKTKD